MESEYFDTILLPWIRETIAEAINARELLAVVLCGQSNAGSLTIEEFAKIIKETKHCINWAEGLEPKQYELVDVLENYTTERDNNEP